MGSYVKGNKAWNRTDFDDELLCKLYLDKCVPVHQISTRLNIGTGSIYRRLRELGIVRTNSEAHMGIRPSNFKGKYKECTGYIMVHIENNHPYYDMAIKTQHGSRYIREHRLIMAEHLGRSLSSVEVVHHKNGLKDDNRIDNLELFPSQAEHHALTLAHIRIKELEKENAELRAALKAVAE